MEAWELPLPLGAGDDALPLPTFPVDVFPRWVAEWVRAIAAEKGSTPDLPASLALGIAAGAVQRGTVVSPRPGYYEPLSLYMIAALPPGARKSPVFKAAIRPVLIHERVLRESWTQARAAVQTAAAESGIVDVAEPVELGPRPQLLTDNATPEAVEQLLSGAGAGRIIVASDEGADFFANLAGRYSGSPSWDVYNTGHSGGNLSVDRSTSEPRYAENAAIALVIATQPTVVVDLCRADGAGERGVLARPLYSLPGEFWPELPTPAAPAPIVHAYVIRMRLLYQRAPAPTRNEFDELRATMLTLTPEARALFEEHERVCQMRARELLAGHAGAELVSWTLKLAGQTARLASVLHVLDAWTGEVDPDVEGPARRIDVEPMRGAIRVADYFAAHSGAVFGLAAKRSEVVAARRVLLAIARRVARDGLPTSAFSTRDVRRWVGNGESATYFDSALRTLAEHGYVRSLGASGRGGRGVGPSPRWDVHPDVLTFAPTFENGSSGRTPTDNTDKPTTAEFVT